MSDSPLSDSALLAQCLQGDEAAWEQLLNRYERLVFSVALNTGLTRAEAADITQVTFTILLQNMTKIKQEDRLGGWLATVARRHAWRRINRTRREINLPDDHTADLWLVDDSLREEQQRQEQIGWLLEHFVRLDERCQALLSALYLTEEPASYDEVAEKMGMKVGSIGPTRIRCLDKLKQLLETPPN